MAEEGVAEQSFYTGTSDPDTPLNVTPLAILSHNHPIPTELEGSKRVQEVEDEPSSVNSTELQETDSSLARKKRGP